MDKPPDLLTQLLASAAVAVAIQLILALLFHAPGWAAFGFGIVVFWIIWLHD